MSESEQKSSYIRQYWKHKKGRPHFGNAKFKGILRMLTKKIAPKNKICPWNIVKNFPHTNLPQTEKNPPQILKFPPKKYIFFMDEYNTHFSFPLLEMLRGGTYFFRATRAEFALWPPLAKDLVALLHTLFKFVC